jgi:hypothetical protein
MKYRVGICKGCETEQIIVHKSLCLCMKCNEKRKKSKYAKNTLRRRKEKNIGKEKDEEFYQAIWEEREHVCYETGHWLGLLPLRQFFHHVLPKRSYPQYRYCKWNIVLLSPDTHTGIETGGLDSGKFPRVAFLTKEFKEKYG